MISNLKILLISLICVFSLQIRPIEVFGQNPPHYLNTFQELKGMLTDSLEPDFKRAVFITENTYLEEELKYSDYEAVISQMKDICESLMMSRKLIYEKQDKVEMEKQAALFSFLTDTITVIYNQDTLYHLPFSYDFQDIWGEQDWSKMLVTKLMATGTGNCHSLPYLYKILADELGAKTWLSLAPNHIYLKSWSKEHGWYNTELTSRVFPVDAWIMASGYVHLDAIRNGMYMDTLSLKQSIALCLVDLANGYAKKYPQDSPEFSLQCTELALEHYPNCAPALLLKAESLKKVVELSIQQQNASTALPGPQELVARMEEAYANLHRLGYRHMPKQMYLQWLQELEKEKDKYQNPDLK